MLPVTLCSGKTIEGLKEPKMKPTPTVGCYQPSDGPCYNHIIPYVPESSSFGGGGDSDENQ